MFYIMCEQSMVISYLHKQTHNAFDELKTTIVCQYWLQLHLGSAELSRAFRGGRLQ